MTHELLWRSVSLTVALVVIAVVTARPLGW